MNSDRKTEILVGLFLFVGLILLGGVILQFGSVRESFRDTYILRVAFPNASGIREGSPVYLGGSKVGKVFKHPQLNDTFTGVVMNLEIYDDIDIPADATFAIGSAGLMGDALIEIKPSGKQTASFLPHDYKKVIEGTTGGLTDLQETAKQVGRKVDVVLDDVRTAMVDIKEMLGRVNKEALSKETVTHFKESMEHLNKTMKRVDEKVLDDENTQNLKTAIADIKEAAAGFKASSKNVANQTERLGPMFDKLDPAFEKANSVMTTADTSLKSIRSAADTLAGSAKTLTSGKGLLGSLLNDAELKTDFKDLIGNMKRSGVLFYKNTADKQRAAEAAQQPPSRGVVPFKRR